MNHCITRYEKKIPFAYPLELVFSGRRTFASRLLLYEEIHCRVDIAEHIEAMQNTTATHLYRIAQEATNNAIHHGAASQIVITLKRMGRGLSLEIADNGSGFETKNVSRNASPSHGMGLRTMEYRANLIGGIIQVENNPDGGTLVRCLILHEVLDNG